MELTDEVLKSLGYEIDDADMREKIEILIGAVKEFLISGGATISEAITSKSFIECISIGVNDLLNSTSGETKFSPAFYIFANQICRG